MEPAFAYRDTIQWIYAILAIFYGASVIVTLGASDTFGLGPPVLLWLSVRVFGCFVSLLILVLAMLGKHAALARVSAWLLAVVVLVVQLAGVLGGALSVGTLVIALLAIAIHVWGAACVEILVRQGTF